MAMFGFVYAWYLMGVLLLEIWFEYRRDLIVLAARERHRRCNWISPGAVALLDRHQRGGRRLRPEGGPGHHDHRHPLRLPAPRLRGLHLRLGQGQPVVEQRAHAHRLPMSAIVSGIALVIFLYMVLTAMRRETIDMRCLDKITSYPVLRGHRRLLAGGARLHPPPLPERGVGQDPRRAHHPQALHEPVRAPDPAGDVHPAGHPGARQVPQVQRRPAQAPLLHGGHPDPARHLQHALERGHRRPALLEELPRA